MEKGDFPIKHKEIFIKLASDQWTEIFINTGGVPSTLQDVKSTRHAGGFAFVNHPNRFIYWRTSNDCLELVEDSLDVNLARKQLRLKFLGSYVLEGISVHENFSTVEILVPTVSSVHRFTFPHPDKLAKKGLYQPSSRSIFHGVLDMDITDSKTYHVFHVAQSSISTVTSCLSSRNEAVFALALVNSTILLIYLDPLNGSATKITLASDSLVPRFFSGLTDSFLSSKDSSEGKCVSMVLHSFKRELYLFSLERDGHLKVWSCDRASFLQSSTVIDSVNVRHLKGDPGQNHKLCKGVSPKGELLLCAHLQESVVVALKPTLENGIFKFNTCFKASPPLGMEIVNMVIGGEGKIWCAWMTGQEQPMVSVAQLPSSEWTSIQLAKPPLDVKMSPHLALDPSQIYLDAILSSGFFTASDVAKALSIYRTSAIIDPSIDIREQIRAIVEAEVLNEVPELLQDDEEYMEVVQRCWSRLFSCCTQHLVSGITPLGLFWLPSCSSIVLVKDSGFSLVRDLTTLEYLSLSSSDENLDITKDYSRLLQTIETIDMEAGMDSLELALHLGEDLTKNLTLATSCVPISEPLKEGIISIFSGEEIQNGLKSLAEELYFPEDYANAGSDGASFCSEPGVGAVVSTFRDLCHQRLKICEKVLLLLHMSSSEVLNQNFITVFASLCKAYYVLHWTCATNISVDISLIEAFASSHPSLMQTSINDCVMSLASNMWPRKFNEQLPHYLLSSKHYSTLVTLCRIVGPYSWPSVLAQAYLATGEPYKALDLLMSQDCDISYQLDVIGMFEKYRHPDLVITAAKTVICCRNPPSTQLQMLRSSIFIHELELGHYDAAYSWVVTLPESSGRSDCLHRLIVEMLSSNKVEELLSFPYTGMLDQLEKILETRARTLPIEAATAYYNLLYSFHVKHDNFKKASSVMYEKGLRSETTEMQWKSYGGCLNALMLVSESDAWILKPTGATDPEEDSIEVLTIADVRKEFEQAKVRYTLNNCPLDANTHELIGMCIGNGHFKTAMRLANLCSLGMTGIIEGFTSACVALNEKGTPWKWLQNNEIYDLLVTENNYKQISWKILEKLVNQYEKPGLTDLHKAVANKLMELGVFLPQWLLSSYKKRNCSELIRLYMQHGDLPAACNLSNDFLKAGLGIGKENFGVECGLISNGPPMWLPLHIFEILLLELKEHKMGEELEKNLRQYVKTGVRVSEDIIQSRAVSRY